MIVPITLAITGASGSLYGLRLLEQLILAQKAINLLISDPARMVIQMETGLQLPSSPQAIQALFSEKYHAIDGQLRVFGRKQWTAPLASGSAISQAMVICPCTSGTLSAIAMGLSHNLIERAADVTLKERRKLILVHRETPLSLIHLENMLRLTKMGAVIMPASPGFYHQPQKVIELVDFIVARILDHLTISHTLLPAWGTIHLESEPPLSV